MSIAVLTAGRGLSMVRDLRPPGHNPIRGREEMVLWYGRGEGPCAVVGVWVGG